MANVKKAGKVKKTGTEAAKRRGAKRKLDRKNAQLSGDAAAATKRSKKEEAENSEEDEEKDEAVNDDGADSGMSDADDDSDDDMGGDDSEEKPDAASSKNDVEKKPIVPAKIQSLLTSSKLKPGDEISNVAGMKDDDDSDGFGSEDIDAGSDDSEMEEDDFLASGATGALKGMATAFSGIMGKSVKNNRLPVLSGTGIHQEVAKQNQQENEKRKLSREVKFLRNKQVHTPIFDVLQKPFEKQLKQIATRGVVKLFNAVHTKQKEMEINASTDGGVDWLTKGKKKLTEKRKSYLEKSRVSIENRKTNSRNEMESIGKKNREMELE